MQYTRASAEAAEGFSPSSDYIGKGQDLLESYTKKNILRHFVSRPRCLFFKQLFVNKSRRM